MVWLWLLFPLLILVIALATWRAARALDTERAGLAAEVRALTLTAEAARRAAERETAVPATGRPRTGR